MIQIANTAVSIASQSLVQEKVKHSIAATVASVGVISETNDASIIPEWMYLNDVLLVGGLGLMVLGFVKTAIEIRILRIELATKDRRKNR